MIRALAALFALAAGLVYSPAGAQAFDPEAVYARVGERTITAADVAAHARSNRMAPNEAGSALLREALLVREAERRGLGQAPDAIRAHQERMVQQLLSREVDARLPRQSVTDEQMRAYYEQHREDFEQPAARHVMRVRGAATQLGEAAENLGLMDLRGRREGAGRVAADPELGALVFACEVGAPCPNGDDTLFVVEEIPAHGHSFETLSDALRGLAWRERRRAAIEALIATARASIEVFDERLANIRIHEAPMSGAQRWNLMRCAHCARLAAGVADES